MRLGVIAQKERKIKSSIAARYCAASSEDSKREEIEFAEESHMSVCIRKNTNIYECICRSFHSVDLGRCPIPVW
jgi:hypothetical protein